MSDQEKRENSYSRRWREKRGRHNENAPITDQNVNSFMINALKNGLNLFEIARKAAEEAAERAKEKKETNS